MTQKFMKVYPTTDDIGKTPIVIEDVEGLNGVNIEFSRTSDEATINGLLTKTAQIASDGQSLTMTGNVVGLNVKSDNESRLATIEGKAIFNQVNVKDYGAVGDGITDDTDNLQTALNLAGIINIPSGTYITDPLNLPSNTVLILDPNVILKAKTGYGTTDCLINIDNKENIVIYGNGSTIQMLKSEYTSGEFRHCVRIYGSSNITIYDLNAIDSGGDGFVVGGNDVCSNVMLINCRADNNRRQGCSITNGKNISVIGGEYKNTIGTAPECGIDIEANAVVDYYLENILIDGARTYNNAGGGIRISPSLLSGNVSINVKNWASESDGDGDNGGSLDLRGILATEKLNGQIIVKDCSIFNAGANGVFMNRWNEYAPKTILKNIYVLNPGVKASTATYKNGFCFRVDLNETYGTSFGYFDLIDFIAEDDRDTPIMQIPVYINNGDQANGTPLKDILIKNPKGSGQTSTSMSNILVSTTTWENVRILYDEGKYLINQSTQTLAKHYLGCVFSPTTSATYTLPLAADFLNAEFSFLVRNTGNLTIAPNASDDIVPSAGGSIISSTKGSFLTIKALESGKWYITKQIGAWADV